MSKSIESFEGSNHSGVFRVSDFGFEADVIKFTGDYPVQDNQEQNVWSRNLESELRIKKVISGSGYLAVRNVGLYRLEAGDRPNISIPAGAGYYYDGNMTLGTIFWPRFDPEKYETLTDEEWR